MRYAPQNKLPRHRLAIPRQIATPSCAPIPFARARQYFAVAEVNGSSLVYLRMFRYRVSADADIVRHMSTFRISEAATLLGVSDDTVRRWVDAGRLPTSADPGRRRRIDGAALAHFAEELASSVEHARATPVVSESARNRFTGLVTRVVRDRVMAQVEIQAGPHRVVSLMSREAADELRLEPGSLAVASVKATNVVVEIPGVS